MIKEGFKPFEMETHSAQDLEHRSEKVLEVMKKRRSIRSFSSREVPQKVLENIIETASSAPSGANKQPWSFCLISNSTLRSAIRKAAEKEEYENYHGRMSDEWLDDLRPFDTDWNKPFIEEAPWLIIMFKKPYDIVDGKKKKNYYVNESAGIAAGFLIMAIHQAGLVTLTHTPSPMNFLQDILDRPENERAFLLLPVGYPAENAEVPVITKKSMDEVLEVY